ncbi:hypothetical protein T4E_5956 [Trichinella pseudospiralis]|uniref:Uncharacterized protein n=1 Tax=Trichinella pseudospiralis TaxID=6337 RepID=A0A0V0XE93_TRIPS|nr:hypothetical protein T4E_5639 [Trichinella pseudospiralis]KRX86354.1 hypothetical protein T4E_5956 [Trichinella pseudospiralis]
MGRKRTACERKSRNFKKSMLGNENQLLKSLTFHVIKFPASNGLSFRGDDESYSVESSEACSLFGLFL